MTCSPRWPVFAGSFALALLLGGAGAASADSEAISEIEAALLRGDGIAAEVLGKRLIADGTDPTAVAAFIGEGELLQEDFADARQWLAPGNFSPATAQRGYHALARLELLEGNFELSAQAFDRALEAGPNTPEIWVDIGRLRYLGGQQLLARDAGERALALGPKNPRALHFMGQLVRDSRGLRAGLGWFARGVVEAPEDLELLKDYAATLGELGRAKDMLRITRAMIALDPNNADAFFLQAVLAARAGKMDLARRLMWRTGEAYDSIPSGVVLHALLELDAGNGRLAVERLEDLARSQPENRRVRLLLARALFQSGDYREVVGEFAEDADRESAGTVLQMIVGRSYEQLGDRRAAARYLDHASRAQDGNLSLLPASEAGALELFRRAEDIEWPPAMVAAIRNRLQQGDVASARDLAARLEARYPHSSDVQVLAGDVALAARDPSGALARYQKAATVRRDLSLVRRMAQAFMLSGQDDQADALVSDYLYQHPTHGAAAAFAAELAAGRGDWKAAELLAEFASRTAYGAGDPQLLALLAEARLEMGKVAEAESVARDAHWLHRANARVASVFSRVLNAGDGGSGAAALERKARSYRAAPPAGQRLSHTETAE